MKKTFALLMMAVVLNLSATWQPIYQYGIMPCDLTIKIYDSSGNILIGPVNGKTPPTIGCGNYGDPAYVRFEILGGPNFNVNLNSTVTQNLPCLGGLTHAFSFSVGKPGPLCDSTFYINY